MQSTDDKNSGIAVHGHIGVWLCSKSAARYVNRFADCLMALCMLAV